MKRDEMVSKIARYLRGCDFDSLSEEELSDEAGFLLSILEKSGMLPPKVFVVSGKTLQVTEQNVWEKSNE